MKTSISLLSGTAGAIVLNLLHETVRHFRNDAPRVDKFGKILLKRGFKKARKKPPRGSKLYWSALLTDLASNAIYFSLIGWGKGKNAPSKGLGLGLLAGVTTLLSPSFLKLPASKVRRRSSTRWMTVLWYTVGGLLAGLTGLMLSRRNL
ncbi:MAG: hypothetical protein ACLFUB_14650 [Cyclobacteriaceae bacterium]